MRGDLQFPVLLGEVVPGQVLELVQLALMRAIERAGQRLVGVARNGCFQLLQELGAAAAKKTVPAKAPAAATAIAKPVKVEFVS